MKQSPVIAPSILSANFAKLGEDVDACGGRRRLEFDVMDNHYVPNLTIVPLICEALRKHGVTAPIDVHLMVKPVDRIVPDFAKAGASLISFHPEASEHIDRTIGLIHDNGCKAGLVLNPATPLSYLNYVLDKLDLVLIMSVNPGFGGQSFIPAALDKLRRVRELIDRSGRAIRLEIDGGVKAENIAQIAQAGADTFVAGSAIFGQKDYRAVMAAMRAALGRKNRASTTDHAPEIAPPARVEKSARFRNGSGQSRAARVGKLAGLALMHPAARLRRRKRPTHAPTGRNRRVN